MSQPFVVISIINYYSVLSTLISLEIDQAITKRQMLYIKCIRLLASKDKQLPGLL
jgi:hypothetical protein